MAGPGAQGARASEALERGHGAYAQRDWSVAYEQLRAVRAAEGLAADDLVLFSDAAWWLGLNPESLAAAEECCEKFLAAGDTERAAMQALQCGFLWFLRGEPDVGSGWVGRGRRLLDGLPDCLGHGLLLWMDANGLAESGDLDGAVAMLVDLHRLADRLGDPALSSLVLAFEGTLAIRQGELRRGLELLDEAMLPVLAGRIAPDWAGNLYCQMMQTCHQLADVPRARRWIETTERWLGTLTAAVMYLGVCRVHRCQVLRLEGDWDAADAYAAAAIEELADMNVETVAEAHYELAETRRLRGDLADARAEYEMARALGRDPEPGHSLLLLGEGKPEESSASVARALAETVDPFRAARLRQAQAEIAYTRSDARTAEEAAAALERTAQTYPSAGFRAWAEHARGQATLCAGANEAALVWLRSAHAAYREMGAQYDAACARAQIGVALGRLGSPAGDELDGALETFRRLGAEPRVAWMHTLLSDGRRPDPVGGLTRREEEILAAVAEGLSNREVAARFVLSEKTVARHLANVYAKLGVTSRTAASAWAHQHGLVGPA